MVHRPTVRKCRRSCQDVDTGNKERDDKALLGLRDCQEVVLTGVDLFGKVDLLNQGAPAKSDLEVEEDAQDAQGVLLAHPVAMRWEQLWLSQ